MAASHQRERNSRGAIRRVVIAAITQNRAAMAVDGPGIHLPRAARLYVWLRAFP